MNTRIIEEATQLLALGMRPKLVPSKDPVYEDLVRRYATDSDFKAAVQAAATGLGLMVLDVTSRSGAVLAAMDDSSFHIRMDEYARATRMSSKRVAEKAMHGLIHLAIAALSFPRPDDLANDTYVGRVSVDQIDAAVRDVCDTLEKRTAAADDNADPLTEAPELERVWRVYSRRAETSLTKDGRLSPETSRGLITKALRFLAEQGMLTQLNEEQGGTYRTTPRYQIQVRELASVRALDELLELDVIAVGRPEGSLRAVTGEPGDPTPDVPTLSGMD